MAGLALSMLEPQVALHELDGQGGQPVRQVIRPLGIDLGLTSDPG